MYYVTLRLKCVFVKWHERVCKVDIGFLSFLKNGLLQSENFIFRFYKHVTRYCKSLFVLFVIRKLLIILKIVDGSRIS